MQKRRKRKIPNFRAGLDYFMGCLMLFGGFFIIFSESMLGYDYFEGSDFMQGWMKWFIGSIFMLYGVFRIYRGYQIQKERALDEND